MLKMEERPYAGKTFRPKPEIHIDSDMGLVIVATPWGAPSAARKVIERMTDYLALAHQDNEATSPFERLTCLSSHANDLRIASLLANEVLYREENRHEYTSGVELFAAIIAESEFVWAQVGNPQILLSRPGRDLLPLGSQIDLAFDLSEGQSLLSPLPAQLLGLDPTVNMNINSFRARRGDKLVLLSHSHPPESLYATKDDEIQIDSMSRALARLHPDVAFWLGILTIELSAQIEVA